MYFPFIFSYGMEYSIKNEWEDLIIVILIQHLLCLKLIFWLNKDFITKKLGIWLNPFTIQMYPDLFLLALMIISLHIFSLPYPIGRGRGIRYLIICILYSILYTLFFSSLFFYIRNNVRIRYLQFPNNCKLNFMVYILCFAKQ